MTTLLWILGIILLILAILYFYIKYRIRKAKEKFLDVAGQMVKDLINKNH